MRYMVHRIAPCLQSGCEGPDVKKQEPPLIPRSHAPLLQGGRGLQQLLCAQPLHMHRHITGSSGLGRGQTSPHPPNNLHPGGGWGLRQLLYTQPLHMHTNWCLEAGTLNP